MDLLILLRDIYVGLELRYGLKKVLGIQNRPTLKLASYHYVLCLNPIKAPFEYNLFC